MSPIVQQPASRGRVTEDFELADGDVADFRLGTDKNAHLYHKGDFYIYIKVGSDALELLPTFNGRMRKSATEKHHLLFVAKLLELIRQVHR